MALILTLLINYRHSAFQADFIAAFDLVEFSYKFEDNIAVVFDLGVKSLNFLVFLLDLLKIIVLEVLYSDGILKNSLFLFLT